MSELPAGPSRAQILAALRAEGFRPSRRLGQNFLLDANLARAIVRDAGLRSGDRVLEVGMGLGFLTRELLLAGARVLAVEVDERLVAHARRFLADAGADDPARFELFVLDVLERGGSLARPIDRRLPGGDWDLVANLPYSVAGRLLVGLALRDEPPRGALVMVQREVAERLAAAPGAPAWGPLSVRVQAAYDVGVGRVAAPGLFWPRPEVESALVRLVRRAGLEDGARRAALGALAGALFQRRRQALGRVLASLVGSRESASAALAELGIESTRRAETLSLEELRALARHPLVEPRLFLPGPRGNPPADLAPPEGAG